MKKGRLTFVAGEFVAVESVASAAKRQRSKVAKAKAPSAGGVGKQKRSRETPKHLEGMELSGGGVAGHWTPAASLPLATHDPQEKQELLLPPKRRFKQETAETPALQERPLSREQSETGLYSLLDAIEYAECRQA